MRRQSLALLACGFLAAGCVSVPSPTPPLVVALAPDRWRVTVFEGSLQDAPMAALAQAARTTLAQGGDWFRVLERTGRRDIPDSSSMFDFQSPVDETGQVRSLEFAIGRGRKPADMNAYDAREVAARLGGAVPRPRVPSQAI